MLCGMVGGDEEQVRNKHRVQGHGALSDEYDDVHDKFAKD